MPRVRKLAVAAAEVEVEVEATWVDLVAATWAALAEITSLA